MYFRRASRPSGAQRFDNPAEEENHIKIDLGRQSVAFNKANDDWRGNPTYRDTSVRSSYVFPTSCLE
jgi:hypothetical protein